MGLKSRSVQSSSSYVIWGTAGSSHAPKLPRNGIHGHIAGQPIVTLLQRDWKRAWNWPANVVGTLEQYQQGGEIPDSVRNEDGLVVVSRRMQEAIERKRATNVEYLPIAIASADFFIIHPLRSQTALDWQQSEFERRGQRITGIRSLALSTSSMRQTGSFFRVSGIERLVFMKRALAEHLQQEDFAGFGVTEIHNYSDVGDEPSLETLRDRHAELVIASEFDAEQQFVDEVVACAEPGAMAFHYELLRDRRNIALHRALRAGFKDRGKAVEPFLADKVANETDPLVAADALLILGLVRAPSVLRLAREYTNRALDPELRRISVVVLGWMGKASDLPALQERLQDAEASVRGASSIAVSSLHERNSAIKYRAVSAIAVALDQERNEETVRCMVLALQDILGKRFGLRWDASEGRAIGDVSRARNACLAALQRS